MAMGKNDARDVNVLLRFLIDEQAADSTTLRHAAGDLADRVQAALGAEDDGRPTVNRHDLQRFLGHFGYRFGPIVAPHLTGEAHDG